MSNFPQGMNKVFELNWILEQPPHPEKWYDIKKKKSEERSRENLNAYTKKSLQTSLKKPQHFLPSH